jgi:hypothetical protein
LNDFLDFYCRQITPLQWMLFGRSFQNIDGEFGKEPPINGIHQFSLSRQGESPLIHLFSIYCHEAPFSGG